MLSVITGIATALTVSAFSQKSLRMLQIRKIEVNDKAIPKSFDGTTMAVFSDVHLGIYIRAGLLSHCVNVINELNPDIVAFAGDLCDESTTVFRISPKKTGEILSRLNPPKGKFAVLGNHDVNTNFARKFSRSALEAGGFQIMSDQSLLVSPKVRLIGLKETAYSSPNIELVLQDSCADEYRILLVHQPDFADIASKNGVHIQFSGHSHGGQIRIPRMPILFKTEGCLKYHTKEYNISGMRLVITHGMGAHTVPLRIFANPDVLFVRFSNDS